MSTNHRSWSDSAEIYVSSIDGAKMYKSNPRKVPSNGEPWEAAVFTGYSNILRKPFDTCNCCSKCCWLCTCSFFIDTTIDENEEMAFLEGKIII